LSLIPRYKIADELIFSSKKALITIIINSTKNILTVIVIELTCDIIYTGLLLSSLINILFVNAILIL